MYTGTFIDDLINVVASTEKRIPQFMLSQDDKLAYWYNVAQRELAHLDVSFAEVA